MRTGRLGAAGIAAVALALSWSIGAAPIAAQGKIGADPVREGQRLFTEQGCYGCHTVGKMGTPIAPDLSKAGAKHSAAYLTQWLKDPSSQRPTAHMPKLQMSDAEAKALAAFLASLR